MGTRPPLRLRVSIGAIIVAGAVHAASAACSGASEFSFGQYYSHVSSSGAFTAQSFSASFWALAFGNPDVTTGVDNGSLSNENWIVPYYGSSGPGLSVIGSWGQSSAINGCIDGKIAPGRSSEIMVVALSDRQAFFSGLFAVAAVAIASDPEAYPRFDFSRGIGRDIALTTIPKPTIMSTAQTGAHTLQVGIAGPTDGQLLSGLYSDGSVGLHDVIVGYRLFTKMVATNATPPTIVPVEWDPVPGVIPLGQSSTLDLNCTRGDAYLALSLVYDSGFESPYLSPHSTKIHCNMCLADADGDGWSGDSMCGIVDCDDSDPATHLQAVEVNDGRDNQCAGDPGFGIVDEVDGLGGFATAGNKTTISWPAQGGATAYQVGRWIDPALTAGCTSFLSETPSIVDPEVPPTSATFYYLIRPTSPHLGSWGTTAGGTERATTCP